MAEEVIDIDSDQLDQVGDEVDDLVIEVADRMIDVAAEVERVAAEVGDNHPTINAMVFGGPAMRLTPLRREVRAAPEATAQE